MSTNRLLTNAHLEFAVFTVFAVFDGHRSWTADHEFHKPLIQNFGSLKVISNTVEEILHQLKTVVNPTSHKRL